MPQETAVPPLSKNANLGSKQMSDPRSYGKKAFPIKEGRDARVKELMKEQSISDNSLSNKEGSDGGLESGPERSEKNHDVPMEDLDPSLGK